MHLQTNTFTTMKIIVDKEGKSAVMSLIDVALKSLGEQAIDFCNTVKHVMEDYVEELEDNKEDSEE